jgi:hypothetical protein
MDIFVAGTYRRNDDGSFPVLAKAQEHRVGRRRTGCEPGADADAPENR